MCKTIIALLTLFVLTNANARADVSLAKFTADESAYPASVRSAQRACALPADPISQTGQRAAVVQCSKAANIIAKYILLLISIGFRMTK